MPGPGWLEAAIAVLFQHVLSKNSVNKSSEILGISVRTISEYKKQFGLYTRHRQGTQPVTDAQVFKVLDMLPRDSVERYVDAVRTLDFINWQKFSKRSGMILL